MLNRARRRHGQRLPRQLQTLLFCQRLGPGTVRKKLFAKLWSSEVLLTCNAVGDNIPGKPRECLLYLGGVPTYYKTIHECASNGYQGFELR